MSGKNRNQQEKPCRIIADSSGAANRRIDACPAVSRTEKMDEKRSRAGAKLCPVDKKACILNRCMIYDEETETCGWAKPPKCTPEVPIREKPAEKGKQKKKGEAGLSSGYRVHLFD